MPEVIRVAQIVGKWFGGGVESIVMNYYSHIDRNKIQFDFICDSDSTNIPKDKIISMGGRVILVSPYQHIFKYNRELMKIFKENKYKIVHSHINTLSIFPLRIAKKAGVPIRIAHSHSTTNIKEWKKNILKQMLRPFSKVYANQYMCCSQYAGEWLFNKKTFKQGKVYLLNNAIDVDKFKYNKTIRADKRKELNIDDNTFVVGHIGRFVEQKNHLFLIDLFNELHKEKSNSLLILVGQGPLFDAVKAKVHRLGLENCVLLLGQRNDVFDLYQAFDMFVLPSLYEGLPVVGVEAQTSGLPSIFSDKITKEVRLLESTKFISLNADINKVWVENMLTKYDRFDVSEIIRNKHFDINIEAKKLTNKYFDLLKKEHINI